MTSPITHAKAPSPATLPGQASLQQPSKADAKVFSRSTAEAKSPANNDRSVDGMGFLFGRKYQPVVNQEVVELNQGNAQALFNYIWGPHKSNHPLHTPIALDAYFSEGGRNHRIYMSDDGREIRFYSPTLNPSGGGFEPQALAVFANNQPPRYLNGLKPDNPVISAMTMSALSKLQQNRLN